MHEKRAAVSINRIMNHRLGNRNRNFMLVCSLITFLVLMPFLVGKPINPHNILYLQIIVIKPFQSVRRPFQKPFGRNYSAYNGIH